VRRVTVEVALRGTSKVEKLDVITVAEVVGR
jgi:hypothetical protein